MDTLKKILAQYEISEDSPCELIRESGDNLVYVVGTRDKKILRVSKRLSIGDVRFEYESIQHLSKNGFPVPVWITTRDGNFYSSTSGAEVAVMFEFLNGKHIVIDKNNGPTEGQAYSAGRALGTISKIGETFGSESSRKRDVFTELERVLKREDIFKKDFIGGAVFVDEVRWAIKFGQESKTPTGLIHNDYRAGNVFFNDDNEVSGVIDFDWSCIGPRVKDLALGVLEWSMPDSLDEADFKIFDSFLSGYNSTSGQKFSKGKELYSWVMFSALSDTATFFCDRLEKPELKKNISYSYMYKKYRYFSKL